MAKKQLNFNIGVLGHVDSGKTSLCKALSAVASTACFDKHPQSKERGITLDLGFSSFSLDLDDKRKEELGHDVVQYTLVDCPGHASLIKTIIGGAQIIDLMFLVVDVMKGIQTQTAECLVIGEILCRRMVVVLNKIDLIPVDERSTAVEKVKKRILKTLESTVFKDSSVIPVSVAGIEQGVSDGISELTSLLKRETYLPSRTPDGQFIFAVDHCFLIRGQGTIMTGTVLAGHASLNDLIEIPLLKITRKIKSMQMFKQQQDSIQQGDRAGVCVTQFDPKLLERGLVCSPGALKSIIAALVSVNKISYFKGTLSRKSKFHITMAHETVMGSTTFFSSSEKPTQENFDFSKEYFHQGEIGGTSSIDSHNINFALLELEKPVVCLPSSIYIGSKLDSDIDAKICRLAFHGHVLESFTDKSVMNKVMPNVKVYKLKTRQGIVDRCPDKFSVIVKSMFKKETDVTLYIGLNVKLSSGEHGVIESSFGQSGKVKIRIPDGVSETVFGRYRGGAGKRSKEPEESKLAPVTVNLTFKRYIFADHKQIRQ